MIKTASYWRAVEAAYKSLGGVFEVKTAASGSTSRIPANTNAYLVARELAATGERKCSACGTTYSAKPGDVLKHCGKIMIASMSPDVAKEIKESIGKFKISLKKKASEEKPNPGPYNDDEWKKIQEEDKALSERHKQQTEKRKEKEKKPEEKKEAATVHFVKDEENLGASYWVVKDAAAEPVLKVTLSQAFPGKETFKAAPFSSSAYGEKLLRSIQKRGVEKTVASKDGLNGRATLFVEAQEPYRETENLGNWNQTKSAPTGLEADCLSIWHKMDEKQRRFFLRDNRCDVSKFAKSDNEILNDDKIMDALCKVVEKGYGKGRKAQVNNLAPDLFQEQTNVEEAGNQGQKPVDPQANEAMVDKDTGDEILSDKEDHSDVIELLKTAVVPFLVASNGDVTAEQFCQELRALAQNDDLLNDFKGSLEEMVQNFENNEDKTEQQEEEKNQENQPPQSQQAPQENQASGPPADQQPMMTAQSRLETEELRRRLAMAESASKQLLDVNESLKREAMRKEAENQQLKSENKLLMIDRTMRARHPRCAKLAQMRVEIGEADDAKKEIIALLKMPSGEFDALESRVMKVHARVGRQAPAIDTSGMMSFLPEPRGEERVASKSSPRPGQDKRELAVSWDRPTK